MDLLINNAVILIQVLICILIADFLTGLFHWAEDTYSTPSMPVIGKYIAVPNIDHHRNPSAMAQGSFFDRVRISFIIAFIILAILFPFGLVNWQVLLTTILTALGNEVHAWSHGAGKKNHLVKFLQDMCIVQTPMHHAKHHIPPYDKDYCVLTNWINPILDRTHFWRILESNLNIFGIKVKRMSAERDGF